MVFNSSDDTLTSSPSTVGSNNDCIIKIDGGENDNDRDWSCVNVKVVIKEGSNTDNDCVLPNSFIYAREIGHLTCNDSRLKK